jgi:hypothetical protein
MAGRHEYGPLAFDLSSIYLDGWRLLLFAGFTRSGRCPWEQIGRGFVEYGSVDATLQGASIL